MRLFWVVRRRKPRRQRRRGSVTKHYRAHKEHARRLVHERLVHWNQVYNVPYKRVAIRDQRSRWGSCSSKQNLNFNYRIIFLPSELVDYIIVHELCHLLEMNHSSRFWAHVERTFPHYEVLRLELLRIPIQSLSKAELRTVSPYSQNETVQVESIHGTDARDHTR